MKNISMYLILVISILMPKISSGQTINTGTKEIKLADSLSGEEFDSLKAYVLKNGIDFYGNGSYNLEIKEEDTHITLHLDNKSQNIECLRSDFTTFYIYRKVTRSKKK